MHPILTCFSHVLQPLTHPPIPHTVRVPCFEDILVSSVMYVLCSLHHSHGVHPPPHPGRRLAVFLCQFEQEFPYVWQHRKASPRLSSGGPTGRPLCPDTLPFWDQAGLDCEESAGGAGAHQRLQVPSLSQGVLRGGYCTTLTIRGQTPVHHPKKHPPKVQVSNVNHHNSRAS